MKKINPCILKIVLRMLVAIGLKLVEHLECDHSTGTQINILCSRIQQLMSEKEE